MDILLHIEYLDDRLLTGLREFLAALCLLFLIAALPGLILTVLARAISRIDPWRILRLGLLLPIHFCFPLFLFYTADEIVVHNDTPEYIIDEFYNTLPDDENELREKQAIFLLEHKRDALIPFMFYLTTMITLIYLLKYWKLSKKAS